MLIDRLSETLPSEQFTSTITISEIVYGAYKSSKRDYHLNNLKTILLPTVNILTFDSKAAYIAGEIRASLESKGEPLQFADIQIAAIAIAIANDLTLVTGNITRVQNKFTL
jgi:tRNA(fMet)-specific endonuclease VapC